MNLLLQMEPIPKARARTIVRNGRVMSFTPRATADAEAAIRARIVETGLFFPTGTPLAVTLIFVVTKPPSLPRKRFYPVTRPDIDNYAKLVMDACNGYLWGDDSQVCRLTVEKRYGSPPAIDIEVLPCG